MLTGALEKHPVAFNVIPLNDSFAVQIEGIALWEEPTAATIERVHDL